MRHELEGRVAVALPAITRLWRQAADQALGSAGISAAAAWVLVYLRRMGASARQNELARAVGVTEPSLARMLDRLEADGLIERRPDAEDRRAKQLHLTERGVTLAHISESRLQDLRSDLLRNVSVADLETVSRVFDRVEQRLAERRLP
jgi:MarR family transcriptional regulator, transcriptional regulator for hemolysin